MKCQFSTTSRRLISPPPFGDLNCKRIPQVAYRVIKTEDGPTLGIFHYRGGDDWAWIFHRRGSDRPYVLNNNYQPRPHANRGGLNSTPQDVITPQDFSPPTRNELLEAGIEYANNYIIDPYSWPWFSLPWGLLPTRPGPSSGPTAGPSSGPALRPSSRPAPRPSSGSGTASRNSKIILLTMVIFLIFVFLSVSWYFGWIDFNFLSNHLTIHNNLDVLRKILKVNFISSHIFI